MRVVEQYHAAAVEANAVMRCSSDVQPSSLRIFVRMSDITLKSWVSLLERTKADFNSTMKLQPFDHKSFSGAVEDVADRRKERNIHKELNRLEEGFERVQDFANAVAISSKQIKVDDILSLVWSVTFAVIKQGLSVRPRLDLETIVNRMIDLHKRMPTITDYKESLSDIQARQKPLQDVFTRYIDAHRHMIETIQSSKSLEPSLIQPYFDESTTLFKQAENDYKVARIAANQGYAQKMNTKEASVPECDQKNGTLLGRGSFGDVIKVKQKSTGEEYALKQIQSGLGRSQVSPEKKVKEEIDIMHKLSHHHITTLAYWDLNEGGFELYIRPVADCDLNKFLAQEEGSTTYGKSQILNWFGCLASALDYAHKCSIMHKDIKPANILLSERDNRVFLTDFGLARDFSHTGRDSSAGNPAVGTRKYHAPECVTNDRRTKAVDIFALGCVFAEILSFLSDTPILEFDEKRREVCGSIEFHAWLKEGKQFEQWLKTEGSARNGERRDRIISVIQKMLEVEDKDRPESKRLVEKFSFEGHNCGKCIHRG